MIFMNYFLQVWSKKLKVCYNQLNVIKRIIYFISFLMVLSVAGAKRRVLCGA